MSGDPFTLLILGPTAGGKSRLAMDLATRLPGGGELISCDSMQIYRGMDIGTAKPTPAERATIPHHLIDIADPRDDTFSVDRWLELAEQTIDEVQARGRTPIVVGGTNLYVQAFLLGLMDGPPPDPVLRAALNELDAQQLRERLVAADPVAAQRIHPNDRKRTIRAVEVAHQSDAPLSTLQSQWADAANPKSKISATADLPAARQNPKSVSILGLDYPVEVINRRINARVKAMIEQGFVEEARRLASANALGRNASEALGYKQLLAHFRGECTLEEAIEQIKIRTRRYAKQQRTWLRRFKHYPNSHWINAADLSPDELVETSIKLLPQLPNRE